MVDYRRRLKINEDNLTEINRFLLKKDNPIVDEVLKTVEKYGGIDEINRKAKEAGRIDSLM
ncbi:hypothetical protein MUO56_02215, partial [Candidatus Bathyarchaeota archaeon]|nr:hypothetical protein [Candidatus Bathyarchaeota archaeon]